MSYEMIAIILGGIIFIELFLIVRYFIKEYIGADPVNKTFRWK